MNQIDKTTHIESPAPRSLNESLAQTAPADSILQLHIAEYQALTMRNTYWITLQYALWPILGVFVGLTTQIYKSENPTMLVWCIASVVNGVVIAYYAAVLEQYNNVRYMEGPLRTSVEELTSARGFWGYERYLTNARPINPLVWELWPAALALGCLSIPLSWRYGVILHPRLSLEVLVCAVNVVLVLIALRLAAKAVRNRHHFWEDRSASQNFPVSMSSDGSS